MEEKTFTFSRTCVGYRLQTQRIDDGKWDTVQEFEPTEEGRIAAIVSSGSYCKIAPIRMVAVWEEVVEIS